MKRLTDSEVRAAFASVNEETPIYHAFLQLLGDNIDQAGEQAFDPDTAREYGPLAHCAGGACWLISLKKEIENQLTEAHPLIGV